MDSKLEKLNSLNDRMDRILDSQYALFSEIKVAQDELLFVKNAILEEEKLKFEINEQAKLKEESIAPELLVTPSQQTTFSDKEEEKVPENEEISLEKFTASREAIEEILSESILESDFKEEEKDYKETATEKAEPYRAQESPKENYSRNEYYYRQKKQNPKAKTDKNLEKFIGENLISKIGVLILILGIAFGTKYSIDNNLISPLARIISGYISALALGVFSFVLRKKYENLSAVLISGATAVSYFVTFSAYKFYDLIPQELAFGLMALFTIFTVIAALSYNKQVIAHIGMVAAYAVPFLTSDGSGRVWIMLSYMTIINIGLLVISFKKYWKPLTYVSTILSWIILLYSTSLSNPSFGLSFGFATVFFIIFYSSILAYKTVRNEEYNPGLTGLLLSNNMIYYIFSAIIINLEYHSNLGNGFFALMNGVLHFLVATMLHKRDIKDRQIIHLLAGSVILFVTISIPLAFDGNVIPVIWIAEAALLLGLARKYALPKYEIISFILMLFSILFLFRERLYLYEHWSSMGVMPIFNEYMLTGTLFTAAIAVMLYIALNQTNKDYKRIIPFNTINIMLSTILLVSVYLLFSLEITHYFNNLISDLKQITPVDYDSLEIALAHSHIWQILYAAVFFTGLNILSKNKIKSKLLSQVSLSFSALTIAVFLMIGLWDISVLREFYLKLDGVDSMGYGMFNIMSRYIALGIMIIHTIIFKIAYDREKDYDHIKVGVELFIALAAVWGLTSEIIHNLDMAGITETYKFGISIGWSVSAILLIILGIVKNKRHFRIFGLVLFSVTIIKLFFYDISNLHIISKTIIMIVLGILMLLTSYLYTRFKNKLFGNESEEE